MYLSVFCVIVTALSISECQKICKSDEFCFQTLSNKNIQFKTSNLIVGNQSYNPLIELPKISPEQLNEKIKSSLSGVIDDVEKIELEIESLIATSEAIAAINDNLEKINSTLNAILGSGNDTITNSILRRTILLTLRTRIQLYFLTKRLSKNECDKDPCQNGGTCVDLYGDYHCNCLKEWQGKNCDVDFDECQLFVDTDLGCQNGGKCVNTNGSYYCDCTPDFRGKHCTTRETSCDVTSNAELCDHGTCVDVSKPIVGRPNYRCICDHGWTTNGPNGTACSVDINECEQSIPPCSLNPPVRCFNFLGGFRCGSCPPGFYGNGFSCTDVDECLLDNGGCSNSPRVQCTNTFGSRICGQCPKGYSGDGITCTQMPLCSTNNGGCNQFATCAEDAVTGYVTCSCQDGYFGNGFGILGCTNTQVHNVSDVCRSNPCGNNGTCVSSSTDASYICECAAGYSGTVCEIDVNECDSNPCKNGATCIDGINSFQCICTVDWQGNTCDENRELCGGSFRNTFGYIKYPLSNNTAIDGDGNSDRSCVWSITTTHEKVLNLQFISFNLDSAADCSNNFMKIFDGRTRNDRLIGKFCGSFDRLPNNGNITTNTEAVTVWLKTQALQKSDVFELSWNTTGHICGGIIEKDHGSIRYPLSGGHYLKNRDCFWFIKVSTSKRIQFQITEMSIEEHPDCSYDFVKIYDGQQTTDSFTSYCTSTSSIAPFTILGSRAMVHFHSDDVSSDSGFYLTYSSVTSVEGCGGTFHQDKGVIRSPNFPLRYQHNLVCDYLIVVSTDNTISLKFTEFELELHPNCKSDFVEIYDGTSERSPLIGRYCSHVIEPPPTIKSTKNSLFIRFKTDDSLSGKGFVAQFETICGGYFSALTGEIKSPNYPVKYQPSKQCVYHIELPVAFIIELQFFEFALEDSPNCIADYVEIREGAHRNATLLNRMCGFDLPSLTTSTMNELWLTFNSDGSLEYRGFYANYTSSNVGCGGVMKRSPGIIESPSHADGDQCNWLIMAPDGFIIQLTFILFWVNGIPGTCSADFVEVRDSGNTILGKYCGTRPPPVIRSTGETLRVTYERSQGKFNKTDEFAADFVFFNASTACGGTITDKSGFLRSPGYPENYPRYRECIWIVKAAKGEQIVLEVKSFELAGSNCRRTYLEIRNGQFSDSPLIGRYCGTKIPNHIVSHSNTIFVRFQSWWRTASGFDISYSTVVSGCGGTITQATGTIASPDYPWPYNHNAVCQWIIHVSHGSSVTINLNDVDVEESDACSLNYLEIFDGATDRSKLLKRICSVASNITLNSSSNIVLVKFKTEASVTRRGFQLSYSTNCVRTIRGPRGIIESPNFPDIPKEDYNCTWIIEAPIGNTILIMFSHLNVTRSPDCLQSFVEVNKLVQTDETGQFRRLAKFCDFNFGKMPDPFNISSNTVSINFVHLKRTFVIWRRRFPRRSPLVYYRRVTRSRFVPSYFRLEWQALGCNNDFIEKEMGTFKSPGYPQLHHGEIECLWHIRIPSGQVELSVHDVEFDSHDCNSNYLKFFSGPDQTSPVIAKLCGITTQTYKSIHSTSTDVTVAYKTDGRVPTKFLASFYKRQSSQTDTHCGGRFEYVDEGTIASRSYSRDRSTLNETLGDDCVWFITVTEMHLIELSVTVFDVESDGNCATVSLTVYDSDMIPSDDNSTLLKLCSKRAPATVRSTGSVMVVRFRNIQRYSGDGLHAQFRSVCGGSKIIRKDDKEQYLLMSPNYPHKSVTNRYCNWTLQGENPSDKILLTFTRIKSDEALNCTLNYVEVREGDTGEGPVIGRFCGNRVPSQIISEGNALHVYLHSNAIFRALFTTAITSCGGYLESEKGYFSSPGYPNNYPLNTECDWWLRASSGNRISISFTAFNIEENEFCNTDYVEIREDGWHGPFIGRYCGNSIPLLPTNISSSNQLWIKFRSDGFGTSNGFMAFYSLQHRVDITGTDGVIASPLYPEAYTTTDGRFEWTITAPLKTGISLTFYDLQIPSPKNSKACSNYIEVLNGAGNNAPVFGRYCGFSVLEPINIASNFISIVYYSTMPSKFSIFWQSNSSISKPTPKPDLQESDCGSLSPLIQLNSTGILELTSPGYPFGYAKSLNCSWIVTTTPGFHFEVDVLDMNIENQKCRFDKVSFYEPVDAQSLSWRLNQSICGRNMSSFESHSNRLRIDFTTDLIVNFTGFKLQLKTVCGGYIYDTSGLISTQTVERREFCEWKVKVRAGRTIKVTFNDDFNIPCLKAHIHLRNGESRDSPFLGKGSFCGNGKPFPYLNTTSNNLFVQFNAPLEEHVSFTLQFEELSLTCGDSIELNTIKKSVDISSPVSDQPDVECDWVIRSPPNTVLRIEIHNNSNACDPLKNYIEVRDGGTIISPLLKRICVPIPEFEDRTFLTSNNMMYVRYATTNLLGAPFSATISINICGGSFRIYSEPLTITNGNYAKVLASNLMCRWSFEVPVYNYVLEIRISSYSLSNNDADCEAYLHVKEIYENGPFLGQYCGDSESVQVLRSSGPRAIVLFQSRRPEDKFSLVVQPIYSPCGGLIYPAITGEITSPGFPNSFPYRRRCNWILKAPIDRRVKLTFEAYNLKPNLRIPGECIDDLRITKSPIQPDTVYTQAMPCNNVIPDPVESFTMGMTITFSTSSLNANEGFKAIYTTDDEILCGGQLSEANSEIISYRFNDTKFKETFYCFWKLDADPFFWNRTASVIFDVFDIYQAQFLTGDYYKCIGAELVFGTGEGYSMRPDRFGNVCGDKTGLDYYYIFDTRDESYMFLAMNYSMGNIGIKGRYNVQNCGGIFTSFPLNISSPGFPQSYPQNSLCQWKLINYHYGAQIKLNFITFDLEENCDNDYLIIRAGEFADSPVIGRFCNKTIDLGQFASYAYLLTFRSDSNGIGKGFSLHAYTVSQSCGGVYQEMYGSFFTPNYGVKKYDNNIECKWIIDVNPGYRLKLSFQGRFDIEKSDLCTKDYVLIEEWIYGKWKEVNRTCGFSVMTTVVTSTHKSRVTFRSNEAVNGDGFYLVYEATCGGTFTDDVGIVTSPGYPNFYANNLRCEYLIQFESDDYVSFKFDDFDVEYEPSGCFRDSVQVYKGNTTDAPIFGPYCGDSSNLPPNLLNRRSLLIALTTDSSVTKKGFKATYRRYSCGGSLTAADGVIKSPLNNDNNIKNIFCVWQITVQEKHVVELRFSVMDIMDCWECGCDTVSIYDSLNYTEGNRIGTFCGHNIPPTLKSTKNVMTIVLKTYTESDGNEFTAAYRTTMGEEMGCGGYIQQPSGVIESPRSANGTYESELDCIWIIVTPENTVISVTFELIDLELGNENDTSCRFDYLELRDGVSNTDSLLHRFCGNSTPNRTMTTSNKIYVHFHSDDKVNKEGFKLRFETVNSSCSLSLIATETVQTITSPNYPAPYPRLTGCTYYLTRNYSDEGFHFYWTKIELIFRDLDIPCAKGDYIEINARSSAPGGNRDITRVCDKADSMLAVYPPVVMKFHSSDRENIENRGFKLEYHIRTCNRQFTGDSGYFESYISGRACKLNITAPVGSKVSIYVQEFRLNFPESCSETNMTVIEGFTETWSMKKTLATICPYDPLTPIFSSTNEVQIVIGKTYFDINLLYSSSPISGCGGNITAINGFFTSPKYPNPFSENATCIWTVTSVGMHTLTLSFKRLELTSTVGCETNFVELFNGINLDNSNRVARYCGDVSVNDLLPLINNLLTLMKDQPADYRSDKNTFALKMVTSVNNTGFGFRVEFWTNSLGSEYTREIIR